MPREDGDVENDWNKEEVCWSISVRTKSGRRREELTDGEDELVVESCGDNLQEDGQTKRRSPKGDVMLLAK